MANKNAVEHYSGTGTNDNDLLFTTRNVEQHDTFQVMSTAGAVDVEATLDGTNWTTAPIALEDQGATTSTTYVLVTAANRMYRFRGKFTAVRVRQNGVTGATAHLLCGSDS